MFKNKILLGLISFMWNLGLKISKGLFAYQYYFEFKCLPPLKVMLERTKEFTKEREKGLEEKLENKNS